MTTSFFLSVTEAADKTGVSREGRDQLGVILCSRQGQTHIYTICVWCVSVQNVCMPGVC